MSKKLIKLCSLVAGLSTLTAISLSAETIAPATLSTESLKLAIQGANSGDIIDLSSFSGTLTVSEIIFPEVSLTIKGPKDNSLIMTTSIESGNCGHSIFVTKSSDTSLTLENLTFKNNITGGWKDKATETDDRTPGIIRAVGPLTLKSCQFIDNMLIKDEAHNNNKWASANVFAEGGLSATDCTFSGTYDNRDSYFDYYGETLLTYGGTIGITNCVFSENGKTGQSIGNVTAVFPKTVSVEGCKFLNNLSQGGSALLICNSEGLVKIRNSIFRKNQSYYGRNNVNVPAFRDFVAATVYGNCGALWLVENNTNNLLPNSNFDTLIENCEFTDCSSFGGARGGAIGWRTRTSSSSMTVVNCTFYHCFSADKGGAIEDDMNNGELYLINTTFSACSSNNGGAALDATKGGAYYLLNTLLTYSYKPNSTQLYDWYTGVGRRGYNSWTKCIIWTKFDANCYSDIHYYADGEGSQVNATYGTAKTTTEYVEGDPYAQWTNSSDFTAILTEYGNFSTDRTVENSGAGPVPVLNEDMRRSRVIEIAKEGPLNGAGYYVKHSEDWTDIIYSKDGSKWTTLLGSQDKATIPLAADQRGVAYKNGKPPIGAAAFEPPSAFIILIF